MEDEKLREQKEDELLRRLLRLAGEPVPVPSAISDRVKTSVHAHWKSELRARARRRVFFIFSGTVAACFLFLLVIWSALINSKSQPIPVAVVQNMEGVVHETHEKISNRISRKSVILAGSLLETEPDTTVQVRIFGGVRFSVGSSTALLFQSQNAFVLQRGTVDFDTGKTGRRLIVATPMGTVTDQGTRFQITVNDNGMEISVREGSVLFNRNGNVARNLSAGDRLVSNTKGELVMSKFNLLESESQPASYTLEGRTLMEFLSWISARNRWQLKFSNPNIQKAQAHTILHGSIEQLTPEQMLAAVVPVCGLTYKLQNGILTIGQ